MEDLVEESEAASSEVGVLHNSEFTGSCSLHGECLYIKLSHVHFEAIWKKHDLTQKKGRDQTITTSVNFVLRRLDIGKPVMFDSCKTLQIWMRSHLNKSGCLFFLILFALLVLCHYSIVLCVSNTRQDTTSRVLARYLPGTCRVVVMMSVCEAGIDLGWQDMMNVPWCFKCSWHGGNGLIEAYMALYKWGLVSKCNLLGFVYLLICYSVVFRRVLYDFMVE